MARKKNSQFSSCKKYQLPKEQLEQLRRGELPPEEMEQYRVRPYYTVTLNAINLEMKNRETKYVYPGWFSKDRSAESFLIIDTQTGEVWDKPYITVQDLADGLGYKLTWRLYEIKAY